MKKNASIFISLAITAGVLAALSGCSGGAQPSSTGGQAVSQLGEAGALPDANAENVVMGILSSVNGNTLEIELIEFQGMGARPQDGSMPDMSDMPDGWQPGNGGQPPQMPKDGSRELPGSMPEGTSPPGGGFPGSGAGTPPTTGEIRSISVDDTTVITTIGDDATLSVKDLQQGDMLSVELAEDGQTAMRISVMRQQADANTEA